MLSRIYSAKDGETEFLSAETTIMEPRRGCVDAKVMIAPKNSVSDPQPEQLRSLQENTSVSSSKRQTGAQRSSQPEIRYLRVPTMPQPMLKRTFQDVAPLTYATQSTWEWSLKLFRDLPLLTNCRNYKAIEDSQCHYTHPGSRELCDRHEIRLQVLICCLDTLHNDSFHGNEV